MDVSIVIVSYNTSKLLDECVESIKRETCCPHEIIVVDNASSDDSCQMLSTSHPDVKLIANNRNSGFARANNQGFSVGKGRYFFMLNPDTVILDGAIDKLVGFMDQNPDIGICGPRNVGRKGELQYNCDHFPSAWNTLCYYLGLGSMFPKSNLFNRCWMRYWGYGEIRKVDRITGCSLLIRANLYNEIGGLDNKYFMYFEETDLCYRMNKIGYNITYYPEASILHYGGESAKKQTNEMMVNKTVWTYFYASQYYFFKKNYGFFHFQAIRFFDILNGIKLLLLGLSRPNSIKKKNEKELGLFMIKTGFQWKYSKNI